MGFLEVRNLTFRYPNASEDALKGVSFSLPEGSFTVLAGTSGSGKSTLLRLLKREISPFGQKSGELFFRGTRLEALDERESVSGIGFVFQNPESSIVTDKVWHELAFGLENLGLPTQEIRRRVAEMAGYFGIEPWFHRNTVSLSGGEKQLLNLASVMVLQPKLLLLDEPTAQLDPIAADGFIETLRKLNRDFGLTILLSEHRLEEVLPEADRLLLLQAGEPVFFGSPREAARYFIAHPGDPMKEAMPSAFRIFAEDCERAKEACPLTVREARTYLQNHYRNEIRRPDRPASPARNSDPVLELRDLWFRYEKKAPDVLKGLSFAVRPGEHAALIGGNGAGKTTALSILAGILKPVSGTVLFRGKRIGSFSQKELYRRGIALLPQDPAAAFVSKTVREELSETAGLLEEKEKAGEAVLSMAERLGIAALLDRHPYDLSGGEQEKAALAKVLLLQPEVLLLDEPTKGLDARFKKELASILDGLRRAGAAIVTITHDIEFAAESADRVALLFDGQVISEEGPSEFFPKNRYYTTAANRISRDHYDGAVLVREVAGLLARNGRKGGEA